MEKGTNVKRKRPDPLLLRKLELLREMEKLEMLRDLKLLDDVPAKRQEIKDRRKS